MFTIKFYQETGRSVIRAAESFTILRDDKTGEAEITMHHPAGDSRIDIVREGTPRQEGWPPVFQWAFIENAMGKTVERIHLREGPTALKNAA